MSNQKDKEDFVRGFTYGGEGSLKKRLLKAMGMQTADEFAPSDEDRNAAQLKALKAMMGDNPAQSTSLTAPVVHSKPPMQPIEDEPVLEKAVPSVAKPKHELPVSDKFSAIEPEHYRSEEELEAEQMGSELSDEQKNALRKKALLRMMGQ